MARNVSFEVRPRYTPGSPGLVPEEVALTVASQEKEHHEIALSGAYGDSFAAMARVKGLNGIVEQRIERKGGWDVTDLITGRTLRRATIMAGQLHSGDRIMRIDSGVESMRWDDHLPVNALNVQRFGKTLVVLWDRIARLTFTFQITDLIKIERDIKET